MRTLKVYLVDSLDASQPSHMGTLECYNKYCWRGRCPNLYSRCKHIENWGFKDDKLIYVFCTKPNSVRFIEDEE